MVNKKILITAGIFLFLLNMNTPSYGQLKIGYMSTQEVLSELPQRSEVEQKLNSYIESRRGDLEERITSFQQEVANYQQNQENMSEQEIQQREQELAEQEASVQEFQQNLQAQIQEQRAKLLEPLYTAMDQAIAEVAESNDLDFVLNQTTNNGEQVIYYSADQQMDITQDVIQQVKESSATN